MKDETLLHRQVHPNWVQQGRITSQVFKPTVKDGNKLSVYDGDQITAVASWEHWTGDLGNDSVGVMSVTVAECNEKSLDAFNDPEPFPEHAIIDFKDAGPSQIEKKAKFLKSKAMARNWQYLANSDG